MIWHVPYSVLAHVEVKKRKDIASFCAQSSPESPESYFIKSRGATPVKSLKIRLKVVLELKPDS
jgi:hypothetical protein